MIIISFLDFKTHSMSVIVFIINYDRDRTGEEIKRKSDWILLKN